LNGNRKTQRKTGQVNISDLDIIMNVMYLPIELEGGGRAVFQDRFHLSFRQVMWGRLQNPHSNFRAARSIIETGAFGIEHYHYTSLTNCEHYGLLEQEAASLGNWLATLLRNVSPSSSNVEESMKVISSFETSGTTSPATRCHIL
jgi:hypothetical protein